MPGDIVFAAIPNYERPTDSDRDNTYHITLQARDMRPDNMDDMEDMEPHRPMTGRIAVTVTVLPRPEPPTITGDRARSIEEGAAVPVWTYIATDQDSDDFIIWQPLEGDDADLFTFTSVGSNGRLAFRATPNYESPAGHTYNVTLAVRAGGDTARREVVVTVTNKDEAGELRLSAQRPVVGVDLTATISDIDEVDSTVSTVWTWERSTSRSGPWTTLTGADNSVTGSSTYTPAEADLNQLLRVTASYTDGHEAGKTLRYTLDQGVAPDAVFESNHHPVFTEGPQQRSVLESAGPNAPVGAPVTAFDSDSDVLTYSLRDSSGSRYFTVDDHGRTAGQIRVAHGVTLDHEDRAEVVVSVTAADLTTAFDWVDVTITIENVNEAPQAVSESVLVSEDKPTTIRVLDNDTDPDGDELTVNIVRQPANGTVTVVDLAIPGERPTVTYTPRANFHGDDSFTYKARDTGSPSLLSSETIVAIVVRSVNDPPTFIESMPTRLVSKRPLAGDLVGAPVTATEIVEGDRVSYSLGGDEAAPFKIDRVSGQITVAMDTTFDVDMKATYTVTVTATDNGRPPAKATVDVIITVIDVNEPPNAVADAATTPEDTEVTIEVLGNDTDPDDDDSRWTS